MQRALSAVMFVSVVALAPNAFAQSESAGVNQYFSNCASCHESNDPGHQAPKTAVLKKMSKLEMEALRNSEEGRRMSKTELQRRSQENQVAISKVEEMRADELGEVVRKSYGDIVRVKIRPSKEEPNAVLIGSAYAEHFYDSPAALSQKLATALFRDFPGASGQTIMVK